jgi:hypothetical protein
MNPQRVRKALPFYMSSEFTPSAGSSETPNRTAPPPGSSVTPPPPHVCSATRQRCCPASGRITSSGRISSATTRRSREPQQIPARLSLAQRDNCVPNDTGQLFDSAWASHVFEEIADPGPLLDGLRRFLGTGAALLVSAPYGHAQEDIRHVHLFHSPVDLHHFLSPHVRVERVDLNTQNQVLRAGCRNAS